MSRNPNIKPTDAAKQAEDTKLAQALQDNPLLYRALDEIEEMYTQEWKRTEGPHDEMRERAYYMVRAIDRLRQHVNEYVTNGKVNPTRVRDTVQGK